MAFEVNELSGSLFENDKKDSDLHPDFTGNCKIEGTMYWVSAWVKQKRDGDNFLSLAFTKQDNQPNVKQSKPKGSSFLGKVRGASSSRTEERAQAQTKFEREKLEFEMMTGKTPKDDEFDDDIPF